jgi:hypothetical protein
MGLKSLPAVSMWTKREFPSERVDKLMENCLGGCPRTNMHLSGYQYIVLFIYSKALYIVGELVKR